MMHSSIVRYHSSPVRSDRGYVYSVEDAIRIFGIRRDKAFNATLGFLCEKSHWRILVATFDSLAECVHLG